MSKRIVVKKKTAVATKKKPKPKKHRYLTAEEVGPSQVKLRDNENYRACYHGIAPPFWLKKNAKLWKSGTWFAMDGKTKKPLEGTNPLGYATEAEASAALRGEDKPKKKKVVVKRRG